MNESYSVKADLKVCKERGRAADPVRQKLLKTPSES